MVEGTPLLRAHTSLNLYRGFESLLLRHTEASNKNAPVAQLDRVLGYEPRGQEFESLPAHQLENGQLDFRLPIFIFCIVSVKIAWLRMMLWHLVLQDFRKRQREALYSFPGLV